MGEPKDKLLSNAGGLFVAAGFIAAFTGGVYGLGAQRPGLVVLSVLLLMGYSVVGYLLINKGEAYYRQALPIASVLVFATLLLFRNDMTGFLDDEFAHFFLYPGLTLVLSYAGGAVVTHALEASGEPTRWPGKRAMSLNVVLHVAAFAPVWGAFSLLYLLGDASPFLRVGILAGSVVVAIASVAGGYASVRQGHPAVTVIGAGLAFGASVLYLFQFMLGGGDRDVTAFGQFVALLGLLLTAFPAAIGTVAWIQVANDPAPEEDGQTAV
jgi:hypothetical protein